VSIQFVLGEMLPPFDLVEQVPALGGIVRGLLSAPRRGCAAREAFSIATAC
jgi:hypothetical protein